MDNSVEKLVEEYAYEDVGSLKKFFKDCYELEVSEKEATKLVFHLFRDFLYRNKDEKTLGAVEVLIKKLGVDVNMPSDGGGSADRRDFMYEAAKAGSAKGAEMLMKNGYNASNYIEGKYPVCWYVKNGWSTEGQLEVLEVFKKYGFDKLEERDGDFHWTYVDFIPEGKRVVSNVKHLNVDDLQEIKKLSPVAFESLRSRISFNKEKAKSKLIEKLVELDCPTKDIISIVEKGTFCNWEALERDEVEYLPIYYDFLKSIKTQEQVVELVD
jgi:hypothetical protein